MKNYDTKFETIHVTVKELYSSVCDIAYDSISDGNANSIIPIFKAFESSNEMIKLFQEGWTLVIMSTHSQTIQQLNDDNIPFIIVIWNDTEPTIWATVNGNDCAY